jgi:hypothetical protein
MSSELSAKFKTAASILIGFGSFYPLSWFSMFLLSPSIGRGAAHEHIVTQLFTYIGVGGLLLGSFFLVVNLYLGLFKER